MGAWLFLEVVAWAEPLRQEGWQALVGKKGSPRLEEMNLLAAGAPQRRGGQEELNQRVACGAGGTVCPTVGSAPSLESWAPAVGGDSLARCAPSPGPPGPRQALRWPTLLPTPSPKGGR